MSAVEARCENCGGSWDADTIDDADQILDDHPCHPPHTTRGTDA